ncbi:tRNA-dihydrouridine(47) synthase [NAD(P)(+)] [Paramyrothecium foliicola]|nr:tRNA-dihydrouridine(47) synthase [NAD(P)(+)] [Paramyrothecium foliicola]
MAEEPDVKMSDVPSGKEHAELARDAASLEMVPESDERAVKRLKLDASAESTPQPGIDQAVPGEGLHDAPATSDKTNAEGGVAPSAKAGDEHVNGRVKGLAPVKKEYLIEMGSKSSASESYNDDAAEGRDSGAQDDRDRDDRDKDSRKGGKKDKKKNRGQNTDRSFGHSGDAIRLCNSRAFFPEFSPRECRFGDRCNLCHDLRKYLDEGRRNDLESFGGKCPIFEKHGKCPSGWKCRFVKSHMKEIEHEDGKKELVLVTKDTLDTAPKDTATEGDAEKNETDEKSKEDDTEEQRPDIFNVVKMSVKIDLNRKRLDFTQANKYIEWLNQETKISEDFHHRRKELGIESMDDLRARFVDPPFKPSEKRRLYFGPETPTLAPLTTQGNLPFRRLCVNLGAQLTYSEMAMGMPLLQGTKADWTLLKVHESELAPPKFNPSSKSLLFPDYDNSRDIKFAAQIAANAPWVATKAADALSRFCPHLRLIDLNCGCPIDMVFKSGGGSALLESSGKLERIIRGMNAVSGEIPITAKIRTGVKSSRPTATAVIGKLAFGAREHRARLGGPGCAAVTLHGRSREQRYTKTADWGYIGECAALIKTYNEQKDALTDTAAEPDESTMPNAKDGRMYFLGNGDCFSHVDYYDHIEKARVDSVMIGRGALVKPWVFEEIEKGQYLDKSATERLGYIEQFVRHGLEAWGSDELGIGFTRRFLLEWLSFAHRYVPIGLLEHLPPSLNDRPPAYRGRNELETLMASSNYQDWIKISEMFLGPVHPGFKFQPKHKSNAYEAEG